MPTQPFSVSRTLSSTARLLGAAAALGSFLLVLHWSRQVALGVPDGYAGQTRGGLLLSLAILTNAVGILVAKPYLRLGLPVLSILCLAAALYFFRDMRP